MNKLLQRTLLQSIQTLHHIQLLNVLEHYQFVCGILTQKLYTKTGMHYKCEISIKNYKLTGFGRNQAQALNNASKNLFSTMISENHDIEIIKECLKYKNKHENQNVGYSHSNETSFLIDQISVIQPRQSGNQPQKQSKCDCVFYEVHQFRQNQVKHLQARIHLLTEQNTMLKKILLQGNPNQKKKKQDKENSFLNANC